MARVLRVANARVATPDHRPWNARRFGTSRASDVRTAYEVDRDRIIHSSTFRELQYKTQVQGLIHARWPRVFRTRLNHVLEVAQIARALSRLLGANETLAEAIALAHDLGHPPFGHAGEKALRDDLRARGYGGWNANVHSLAVVDLIEAAFIDFRGLDLTWATREGIARHSTPFDEPVSFGEFAETRNPGFECQIADVADVFAYVSHDLDDALAGGYLRLEEVRSAHPLLGELISASFRKWDDRSDAVWAAEESELLLRKWLVATLVYRLITDTAETTQRRLDDARLASASDVRAFHERIVQPSDVYADVVAALLQLLTQHYYRSREVAETDAVAVAVMHEILEALLSDPSLIPSRFRSGNDVIDAATYLASLNDHTAMELAQELRVEQAL